MKKLFNILFFISLFISLSVVTSGQVAGLRGIPGERVTPTLIYVRDLPAFSGPRAGAGRVIPLGEVPEGKVAFEEWKKKQPPVHVTDNVTIDPSATGAPSPLAPIVSLGFEGTTQHYDTTQQGIFITIPGEPQPAVGPNHVMIIGNVSVVIANKDGTGRTEVLQMAFFGIPPSDEDGFDGKCFYDALNGRFVALTETQGKQGSTKWSNYYLAISQTSDARGSWWIYKFDMTKDGTTSTSNWTDFPGLGISDDKLVMSGQQYSFGGNQYQYQKLRVISRDSAYAGHSVTYVDFANFAVPPGGTISNLFVTKPGRNVSPDPTIHLFTTRYAGGSNVAYRTITGPPSAPVLSAGTVIPVNPYGAAVDARQLGTTNQLDGGDCRTPDFFVRNGILHIAWHFGNNFGSGTVDAIRYLKLRTSDLAVLTDETFGADGVYYYYPMVCVDSVGTMFMGFCRSRTSEYSSSWVTGKRRLDATIQPSSLAKSGVVGNTQTRWGDFTGINMDESASNSGGSSAWYSGLWAKGSNTFGTWVSQMTFSYGRISGQVLLDADGDTATAGDRTSLSGWAVTLKQGSTTISTTLSDNSGNYDFGYLESGTYRIVLSLKPGYYASGIILGSGGTSQTRIDSITIADSLNNSQTSSGNIFLVSQRSIAAVRLFLQGPFSLGSMTTQINDILPPTSPYDSAPRTVAAIPGANIVDWINIELRATSTGPPIASKSFFLRSDGNVVDSTNIDTNLEFEVTSGNYYIVIRHRNHLPVMTVSPVNLASTAPSSPYDFTTAQSMAYGSSAMKELSPGVFGMVTGEVDFNGGVGASDIVSTRAAVGTADYTINDIDLNGGVGASDIVLVRSNIGYANQVP